ncbi:MAG: hypothetical protein WD991_02170 [Candidatus Paceibacterota bacterium]
MSEYTELYGFTSDQTISFFAGRLREEVSDKQSSEAESSEAEMVYVASILAHFAQTSRSDATYMSSPGSLCDVFDAFVFRGSDEVLVQDPEILEIAGTHVLFLAGFFRDQMQKKHNLEWYDFIGGSFFGGASARLQKEKRAALLRGVAANFNFWAVSCRNLSRTLRDERYLLRLD